MDTAEKPRLFSTIKVAQGIAPADECEENEPPTYFVGEGAIYENNRARITIAFYREEYDGELDELDIHLECEGPSYSNWLGHEIDGIGLAGILGAGHTEEEYVQFMLENGIAPGQEVFVEIIPHYYKSWTDYGYEYDCEMDYQIISLEQWSSEDILAAWEKYYNGWFTGGMIKI